MLANIGRWLFATGGRLSYPANAQTEAQMRAYSLLRNAAWNLSAHFGFPGSQLSIPTALAQPICPGTAL